MSSHRVDDPQIREELELQVRRMRADLECCLAQPEEPGALAAVAASVDLVQRGFLRLGCEDGARLAKEMAGLVGDLTSNRIPRPETGREAVLQAVVETSQYVEWLRRGQRQQPFELLPLINHLRRVRGLAPEAIHRIRAADFQSAPGGPQTSPPGGSSELAARLRPVLQEALLNLLRGNAAAESLEHIIHLLSELKAAAPDERSYRFWWLAESLVREIEGGAIPLDQTVAVLLRDVDVRLKHLLDNGKLFSDQESVRTLGQRFINQLARCQSGLERLKKRTDYDPPRTDLTAASRSMLRATGLPDVETLMHTADLLREKLATVKDALQEAVAPNGAAPEMPHGMAEQGEHLHAIANVLVLLNMGVPAGLLERQREILQHGFAVGGGADEERIAGLAKALVLVEDSLNGVGEYAYNHRLAVPAAGEEANAMLTRCQYQWTLKVTLREMVDLLAQIRALTSAGAGGADEARAWRSASVMLHEVTAVLSLLEHSRAAALFGRLERVMDALARDKVEEKALIMDAFSELTATLEYYLRLLDGEASMDQGILDYAERQVILLEGLVGMPLNLSLEEETRLTQSNGAGMTTPPIETHSNAEPTPPTASPDLANIHPASSAQPSPAADAVEVDPEFVEVFFEEAQGELASIREQLAVWRQDLRDREALTSIRRSFHTLKGSGRMVGQTTIGEFAWRLEQLLNRVRDGELAPALTIADTVDAAQAALQPLVDGLPEDDGVRHRLNALAERAAALMRGEAVEPAVAVALPEAVAEEEPPTAAPIATVARIPETPAAAPPALAAGEVDPELIEIFVQEAAEILDASDTILERWRVDQSNGDLLNELRREMHTLKGSSRMTGFMTVGDLAHAMESVLNVLSAEVPLDSGPLVGVLQRSLDRLNSMVMAIRRQEQPGASDDLIGELRRLVGETPAQGKPLAGPEETGEELEEQPIPAGAAEPPSVAAAPPTADRELTELDQELVAAFRHEAAELLDSGDVTLQRWSADLGNMELLNDLRREMHTLKGSSRMTGFMAIGDLAHAMESVLDAIGKGGLQPGPVVVEVLQRALDGLHGMMGRVQSGTVLTPAETLVDELRGLLGGEAPAAVAARPAVAAPRAAQAAPEKLEAPVSEDTIRVSASLLNKLVNEMGESSIYRARIDQGVSGLRFNISELEQTVHRLRQQLRRLEIETEAQILFRYEEGKSAADDFDPLELDRFSELQQLSRSLIEIVDDLANIQTALDDQAQEMSFLLDQQAKVNKEVQQGLMRTRMVRFSSVAPRLRRVVRQVAQELGKKAELVFEGSEAEVDRTVLDNMVAPLEHMLRNSISHGLEGPEERRARGKTEKGTIVLAIRREGAELVMNLRDDGAGLNFTAIRAKGEAQGLLRPGKPVSEDDLIALLLRPGFSTATKVSQISGRGVGMDVLNNAIKAMRGALLIRSEQGRGADFMIRLPFSLAVTQALLVRVGNDTYAVPLLSISSVARLDEAQYKAYLSGEPAEHLYGEHRFPVHNLGILFGVQSAAITFEKALDKRPPLLLFRSAEASAALQVDAVLGNQEIIVKPVGPQFQSITGISGATVLGDGRVVVVLELAALVRNLTSQSQKQAEAQVLSTARQEEAVRRERVEVLVVDDSITMRKVTARFLERHNMSVTTAKDGMDALAKLEEQVPDLVIMDIEMPRMDGFEVTAHIRNQPHLQHIPIIMVTSRGGEKHRARAAKLGVNDYLTKPYQEEQMMQSIRRVLGKRKTDLSASPVALG
jgi:chemosensory pili system protein ChpA (sensor histidine kinase/response regulator)